MKIIILWLLILVILGVLFFEFGYYLGKRHERAKQEREEVRAYEEEGKKEEEGDR